MERGEYIIFFFLLPLFKGQNLTIEKCDLKKFSKEMNKVAPFLEDQCYMCSTPVCDFSNSSCNYTSTIGPIPLYNNLLQGALIPRDMYLMVVNINYAEDCNLEMRFYIRESLFVRFYECRDRLALFKDFSFLTLDDNCKSLDEEFSFEEKDFFLFTFVLSERKATAYFQADGKFFKLHKRDQTEISLNCSPMISPPEVQYTFYHSLNCSSHDECTVQESSGLLMPCTTGGFLVDKSTGELATRETLKKLTNLEDATKIAQELDLDPNDKFPPKTDDDPFKPEYVDEKGNAQPGSKIFKSSDIRKRSIDSNPRKKLKRKNVQDSQGTSNNLDEKSGPQKSGDRDGKSGSQKSGDSDWIFDPQKSGDRDGIFDPQKSSDRDWKFDKGRNSHSEAKAQGMKRKKDNNEFRKKSRKLNEEEESPKKLDGKNQDTVKKGDQIIENEKDLKMIQDEKLRTKQMKKVSSKYDENYTKKDSSSLKNIFNFLFFDHPR